MVELQYIPTPTNNSDSSSTSSTSLIPLNLPPTSSSSNLPVMCFPPEFQCYYYYDYNNYPFYFYPSSTIYLYSLTATFPSEPPLITPVHGYGDSSFVTPSAVVLHSHHHYLPPPPPLPPSGGGNGCRKSFYNRRNHGFQNHDSSQTVRLINKKGKGKRNGFTWRPKHATTITGSGSHFQTPPPPTPTPTPTPHLSNCTTVMVKNIPNNLRRKEFINMLDHHCRHQNSKVDANPFPFQYDFLYLPFDFIHKRNLGYAFVNFTTVEGAITLHNCWTGKGWESWNKCSKIREITPAKLQGLEKCKKHFKVSIFHCHSEEYLPVEFTPPRDGSNGYICKMKIIGTMACRRNNAVIDAPKPKLANADTAAVPKPKSVIGDPPKPKPVIAPRLKPSWFRHQHVIPPRLSHRHSKHLD